MSRATILVSTLVIVAIVLIAPMAWNALGLENAKTVTITKPVTQTVENLVTVTSPVIVTKERLQPTTITETKTFTKTVTTISTKLYTHYATITTTKLETTARIITIPLTTITKTITETQTITQNRVLEVVEYNYDRYNETAGEEVAKWILRANRSIYAMIKADALSSPGLAEPLLRAFEELEKKGVEIVLIGEDMPDMYVVNKTMAKKFCRWFKSSVFFPGFYDNAIAIDERIVIVIGNTQITVIESPELAHQIIEDVKHWLSNGPVPPMWCS